MNREQKKLETRQKIIDTAIQLISIHGYEATTVAQIAEESGISKGTFFNYFETKEDVLHAYENMSFMAEAAEIVQKPGPMTPRLMAAITGLLTRMNYTRTLRRACFQATLSKERYLQEHIQKMEQFRNLIAPFFAIGQERGEYSTKMPPIMLADMLIQTYQGVLTHWCLGCGDDNVVTQMMLSFELFFDAISVTRMNTER